MPTGITISHQLEIIAGKISIPGCEAPSAFSSNLLIRHIPCCNTVIDEAVALAAIPEATIRLQINSGEPHGRRKFFVLPPLDTGCSCEAVEDYYKILREAACEEDDESIELSGCEPIDMGYCPPRDLTSIPTPPVSTYGAELPPPTNLRDILVGGYSLQGPSLADPIMTL